MLANIDLRSTGSRKASASIVNVVGMSKNQTASTIAVAKNNNRVNRDPMLIKRPVASPRVQALANRGNRIHRCCCCQPVQTIGMKWVIAGSESSISSRDVHSRMIAECPRLCLLPSS